MSQEWLTLALTWLCSAREPSRHPMHNLTCANAPRLAITALRIFYASLTADGHVRIGLNTNTDARIAVQGTRHAV